MQEPSKKVIDIHKYKFFLCGLASQSARTADQPARATDFYGPDTARACGFTSLTHLALF